MKLHRDYHLDRFVEAQDRVWADVQRELRAGKKQSHWIWFVFPQLRGLGSSATAARFAISSLAEARAYLVHDVLGARLHNCTELVLGSGQQMVVDIFGHPDDLKFRSCMTLFDAAGGRSVFRKALEIYFQGEGDPATLNLLGKEKG